MNPFLNRLNTKNINADCLIDVSPMQLSLQSDTDEPTGALFIMPGWPYHFPSKSGLRQIFALISALTQSMAIQCGSVLSMSPQISDLG